MRIGDDSQLPLTALKGALLTNEHGAEYRIHGFFVYLGDVTKVMVRLARKRPQTFVNEERHS